MSGKRGKYLLLFGVLIGALLFAVSGPRPDADLSSVAIKFICYEPTDPPAGMSYKWDYAYAVIQITNATNCDIDYLLRVRASPTFRDLNFKAGSLQARQGLQVKMLYSEAVLGPDLDAKHLRLETWRKIGFLDRARTLLGELGIGKKPVRRVWERSVPLPPRPDFSTNVPPHQRQ